MVTFASSMVRRSDSGIARVSCELAMAVTLFIMSVADFSSSSSLRLPMRAMKPCAVVEMSDRSGGAEGMTG